MRLNILSAFILFLLVSFVCSSQDSISYKNQPGLQQQKLGRAIIYGSTLYTGGMSYLSYRWYHGDEKVPFYFSNDFKAYLQADKFKHSLGSYIEGYIGYHYLRNAGASKKSALLFGGTLGIILQSPKELIDGHYVPGGFSWPDIAANALGSALLISQEVLFDEQVLIYKFSFSQSEYSGQAPQLLGNNFLRNLSQDYNGQTYWLSFNVNRLILKKKLPGWINIAAGYSVNGVFGKYENPVSYNGILIPETERYRQYLLSMDIDWTKIHSRSRFLNIVLKGLTFIKLPFPAMEVNSKGQVKGHWIYF
jgi:hypothetical protein